MASSLVVYVLRCEGGRFYVGSCGEHRVHQRFAEHCDGTASAFTSSFLPVDVLEVLPAERGVYDEDAKVLEYMKAYGVDNVRGGTFSRLVLPEHQLRTLRDQLTHGEGSCFSCGSRWHFADRCPVRNASNASVYERRNGGTGGCFRCGRTGHMSTECFARTTLDGRRPSSSAGTSIAAPPRRRPFRQQQSSSSDTSDDEGGRTTTPYYRPRGSSCFRCGRTGHVSGNCFARSHVTGRHLYGRR